MNFICLPEEARRRIKRVEQMGFDEILIGSQFGVIEEIERVRDFLKAYDTRRRPRDIPQGVVAGEVGQCAPAVCSMGRSSRPIFIQP